MCLCSLWWAEQEALKTCDNFLVAVKRDFADVSQGSGNEKMLLGYLGGPSTITEALQEVCRIREKDRNVALKVEEGDQKQRSSGSL